MLSGYVADCEPSSGLRDLVLSRYVAHGGPSSGPMNFVLSAELY